MLISENERHDYEEIINNLRNEIDGHVYQIEELKTSLGLITAGLLNKTIIRMKTDNSPDVLIRRDLIMTSSKILRLIRSIKRMNAPGLKLSKIELGELVAELEQESVHLGETIKDIL